MTLKLKASAQAYFDALREKHFPRHCNYMDAHLTLFHHLASNNPFISKTLASLANRPIMELDVATVRNIGNGVAYAIGSQPLKRHASENAKKLRPSPDLPGYKAHLAAHYDTK